MSLHRICCCGQVDSGRLWLQPSPCNDDQPNKVLVFEANDCNLTTNSQLYKYDNGAFFDPLKYCGVLRREKSQPASLRWLLMQTIVMTLTWLHARTASPTSATPGATATSRPSRSLATPTTGGSSLMTASASLSSTVPASLR